MSGVKIRSLLASDDLASLASRAPWWRVENDPATSYVP